MSNITRGFLATVAAAALTACSQKIESPTAPSLAINESELTRIEYAGTCNLKYVELDEVAGLTSTAEPIRGTGKCMLSPWTNANIVFEGVIAYKLYGYVLEGRLIYTLPNGQKLMSNARMASTEVGTMTLGQPMEFKQDFIKGTGGLAGVRAGHGEGPGTFFPWSNEATYQATGVVLLLPPL